MHILDASTGCIAVVVLKASGPAAVPKGSPEGADTCSALTLTVVVEVVAPVPLLTSLRYTAV